ncbi:MAG: ABC transporter ATP-binding protein [Myxococcales bacterium]|nr:ABC transporter ATP-binding protein [Myxococcales bacterium]
MLRGLLSGVAGRWRQRRLLVPSTDKGEAKIAVSRVAHSYRDVEALKNVTLNIHHGEFVCLLGPSGCGKTTLLYALAGQVSPTFGNITIDGEPVKGPSPDRLLMFQEAALFPWLTVRQNLHFALRSKERSKRRREDLVRKYIRRVQLEGFEDALPHQLSAGMRMRVSLARALTMNPAVLLMDEPFAALDAQTRGQMHQLLQRVWLETRKTVVFVTHDVREALVLGDRVVVMAMRPGHILTDLEVRLPRPRDPDDEKLVLMSRQIREMLRRAGAAERPGPEEVEERDGQGEGPPVARSVPTRAPRPVGARF